MVSITSFKTSSIQHCALFSKSRLDQIDSTTSEAISSLSQKPLGDRRQATRQMVVYSPVLKGAEERISWHDVGAPKGDGGCGLKADP